MGIDLPVAMWKIATANASEREEVIDQQVGVVTGGRIGAFVGEVAAGIVAPEIVIPAAVFSAVAGAAIGEYEGNSYYQRHHPGRR